MIRSLIPKLRRDYKKALLLSQKQQAVDMHRLAEIQLQLVGKVWNDAVSHIPYYKSLVAHGEAPERISSWDEFKQVPVLTRRIIRENQHLFVRSNSTPSRILRTGGSTGEPMEFGATECESATLRQLKLVLWVNAGYKLGERLVLLWGHSHMLGTGVRRYGRHLARWARDAAAGYCRLNAYSLSPLTCRQYAQSIIRIRPAGVIGYAAALDHLVRAVPDLHSELSRLGVKFVMPCAEPLPRPDSRHLLSSVFNCPVVQEFGGVDFGHVAMQLSDAPFEVFHSHNLLEVRDEGPNNGGSAIVTPLYERFLPLVRYQQGDMLRDPSVMKHGHVKSFGAIGGRVNDMVELPSGEVIHSVAFLHCMHQEAEISACQLVARDDRLTLRVVVSGNELSDGMQSRIHDRLGGLAEALRSVEIVAVDDVETSVAGKRRWFIDNRLALT